MLTTARTALAALVIAAAVPASAMPRGGYYQPYYRPAASPDNAVRLEVGGASISSPGLYCPGGGGCVQDLPFDWQALSVGGELDLGLGHGPVALTLGAHELAAPYYSGNPSIFEPSIGLTFRFLRHQPIQPRLGVGVGLMLGNDGNTGAAFRLGGGLSLFANSPVGLAFDLMFDFGRFGGYGVSQVQFAVGPEFHF